MTGDEMDAFATLETYHGTSVFTDASLRCKPFAEFNFSEAESTTLPAGEVDGDAW